MPLQWKLLFPGMYFRQCLSIHETFLRRADFKISRSANFNPDKPAPYDQEGEVVFICIDVEANERNASQITEIGVATLDTRDLKSLTPGKRGENWSAKLRARH